MYVYARLPRLFTELSFPYFLACLLFHHFCVFCFSFCFFFFFFFSSRRRHTRSVSAFLLNRSSDLWLDLVASLPLIKERILVIILLLHFLSLMLGSVLVLMLPLLVWLTPDLRIKKSLLKCNWTIRKRLPRCKMRLKKRLL